MKQIIIVFAFLFWISSVNGLVFVIDFNPALDANAVQPTGELVWNFDVTNFVSQEQMNDVNLGFEYLYSFDDNSFKPHTGTIFSETEYLFKSEVEKDYFVRIYTLSGNCTFTLFASHPSNTYRSVLRNEGTVEMDLKVGSKVYLIVDPDSYGDCILKVGDSVKTAYFNTRFNEIPSAYQYMSSRFYEGQLGDQNCLHIWESAPDNDKICYDYWSNLGCSNDEIIKFDRIGCLNRLLGQQKLNVDAAKLAEEQAKKESVPEVVMAINQLVSRMTFMEADVNQMIETSIGYFSNNLNLIIGGVVAILIFMVIVKIMMDRNASHETSVYDPALRPSKAAREQAEKEELELGRVEPKPAEPSNDTSKYFIKRRRY